ncbi:MAG TPA: TadE family protein [Mycobacteriales bacterium]|nr:TadE family protein [Mycobacteriales bacterium]
MSRVRTGRAVADRRRGFHALLHEDRGAGALEFALITPIFITLAFIVVQAGLYWEARNVLDSIADDTGSMVRAGTSYPGVPIDEMPPVDQMTTIAGQRVTEIRDAPDGINGGKLARDIALQSVSPATREDIRVTVTGRCISVLGFFDLPTITVSSEGPYEGFHPAGEGAGG